MQNTLAEEFADLSGSGSTSGQIERALLAFIDPNNKKMRLDDFFGSVLNMAVGDDKGSKLFMELIGILENVKGARKFNATYLGHELSEPSIPGMLGTILGIRMNSNTVAEEVSIQETKLEPEAIHGLLKIVGFDPDKGSGTFTSGGTLANMAALAVARKLKSDELMKENRSPQKMLVLTTPYAHYSVKKVCDLLSGSDGSIQVVSVGSQGFRMSVRDLQTKFMSAGEMEIPVMAVVAMVGETETGLVDPISEIIEISDKFSTRVVVDGAYGAAYRLSKQVGHLFKGMEKAFAVVIDPHKTLYLPYASGAVLFKNVEDHARLCMGVEADYLQFEKEKRSIIRKIKNGKALGQKRIEGSMGAGPILGTVAVLRTLGLDGLGVIYDLTIDRVNYLYSRLKKSPYLMPVHKPDLNLLCFALNSKTKNKLGITSEEQEIGFIRKSRRRLDNNIKGEGGYFFSETILPSSKRICVWRACIMHPRTTNEIINQAVTDLEKIIEENLS